MLGVTGRGKFRSCRDCRWATFQGSAGMLARDQSGMRVCLRPLLCGVQCCAAGDTEHFEGYRWAGRTLHMRGAWTYPASGLILRRRGVLQQEGAREPREHAPKHALAVENEVARLP